MNSFVKRGRSILDSELKSLDSEIVGVFQDVEMNLLRLKKCVSSFDLEAVQEVLMSDEDINKSCIDIEKHAYKIISLQQPITSDLRHISAIVRLIPDIERIGDHAKGIMKSLKRIDGLGEKDPVDIIYNALDILASRLKDVLESFLDGDEIRAEEISKGDDEIDMITKSIIKFVIDEIKNDDIRVKDISELFFIAKSIERIGDYIVNICESIVFMKTGKLVEFE